jgi:hypothetical protein
MPLACAVCTCSFTLLVLQSLGLVLLVQSILVLQPTSTPAAKATALNLHQASLPFADARSASLTTRTAPQPLSRAAAVHCGSLDHVAPARAERRPLHQVRMAEQQGRAVPVEGADAQLLGRTAGTAHSAPCASCGHGCRPQSARRVSGAAARCWAAAARRKPYGSGTGECGRLDTQ